MFVSIKYGLRKNYSLIIGGLDCPPSSIPWNPDVFGHRCSQSDQPIQPLHDPLLLSVCNIVQDQDRQSVQNRQTIILKSGKRPQSYVSVVLMVVFVVEIYSWSLGGEQFVSRPGTLYNPGL